MRNSQTNKTEKEKKKRKSAPTQKNKERVGGSATTKRDDINTSDYDSKRNEITPVDGSLLRLPSPSLQISSVVLLFFLEAHCGFFSA